MELTQNLIMVFVSFSMGAFLGALWMFFSMYKELKAIQKELDSKTETLNTYVKLARIGKDL